MRRTKQDPNNMTLAQIERELAIYDAMSFEQLTPSMIDRVKRLSWARDKVRYGRFGRAW